MKLNTLISGFLMIGVIACANANAQDRVAFIGDSSPQKSEGDSNSFNKLVDIVLALDKVTHTSSKIVVLPFDRSLKDTAAGLADFHLPFVQNGDLPAPYGLAYVSEVDFGYAQFVIYSRKETPVNVDSLVKVKRIEIEPGHEFLFPFSVNETHCVPCSLDKILFGSADALIVSSEIVDPLLSDPKYKGIHRSFYNKFPIRALVPTGQNTDKTRRYLIEGVGRLKRSGELWKIIHSDLPYSDWQP